MAMQAHQQLIVDYMLDHLILSVSIALFGAEMEPLEPGRELMRR